MALFPSRVISALTVLAVSVLIVVGPASAVGHEHSSHDHGAMHSTPICIWMCAAAAYVAVDLPEPTPILPLAALAIRANVQPFTTAAPLEYQTRAPPFFQ